MPLPIEATALDALTDDELAALSRASVWYFKRHARMIADEADDFSARAVEDRKDFMDLHSALRKLGISVALPDELRIRSAA